MPLPTECLCQKFLLQKQLKGVYINFAVQCQRFAFVIKSTASIKLLTNPVHVVYLVLVQRLKSLEIVSSLILNPN